MSARFRWLIIGPSIVYLAMFAAFTLAGSIYLSLQNRTLGEKLSPFVGIRNFQRLFNDHRFHNALAVSAIWELVTVFGTMVLATALAVALYEYVKRRQLRDLLCLLFLIPILLPRVAVAYIWRFIYSPTLGIANYLGTQVGLPPSIFLSSPDGALYWVAAVDIWQWALFYTVIIAKLIETLPPEPLEAAKMDSAGTLVTYGQIILPMLSAPMLSLALVKSIESLRSFDLIFIMTGGGPGTATETLDLLVYQVGLNLTGRVSYASAMSLVLLIVTAAGLAAIWKGTRKWAV